MRSFAYGKGLPTKCRRPCRRSLDVGDLPDKPPQPLNEAPRTLNAFLGPDHVAVGGGSDSINQRAVSAP